MRTELKIDLSIEVKSPTICSQGIVYFPLIALTIVTLYIFLLLTDYRLSLPVDHKLQEGKNCA